MSALYSALCDLARARDERNASLRDELQALADEIRTKGEARAREEAKERAERVRSVSTQPIPAGTYGRLTCSLCGSPSDRFTCSRCDAWLESGGGL